MQRGKNLYKSLLCSSAPLLLRSSAQELHCPFIHQSICNLQYRSPNTLGYPRFALDQRTKDGIILGLYYYPDGTELAEQFGDGWRYALMPNKNFDEISYLQENQIQPLTPEELFHQITAEIDFYQQQISILSRQLTVLTGGANNG